MYFKSSQTSCKISVLDFKTLAPSTRLGIHLSSDDQIENVGRSDDTTVQGLCVNDVCLRTIDIFL